MKIIEKNKYYILVNGNSLLVNKPWKNLHSALWQYNDRVKCKYAKTHYQKEKRGKCVYNDLRVIEIDVAEPQKSRIVKP